MAAYADSGRVRDLRDVERRLADAATVTRVPDTNVDRRRTFVRIYVSLFSLIDRKHAPPSLDRVARKRYETMLSALSRTVAR